MADADNRLAILETRFDTKLRHLATKADLTAAITGLERRMFTALLIVGGAVIAAIKFL